MCLSELFGINYFLLDDEDYVIPTIVVPLVNVVWVYYFLFILTRDFTIGCYTDFFF